MIHLSIFIYRTSSWGYFNQQTESLSIITKYRKYRLVVWTPLTNMSPLGSIPNVWNNETCSKPPERTEVSSNMASALVLIHFERWDFHKAGPSRSIQRFFGVAPWRAEAFKEGRSTGSLDRRPKTWGENPKKMMAWRGTSWGIWPWFYHAFTMKHGEKSNMVKIHGSTVLLLYKMVKHHGSTINTCQNYAEPWEFHKEKTVYSTT